MALSRGQLSLKLSSWSTAFAALSLSGRARFPIVLFQNAYALLHELRASVAISDDAQIKALSPIVGNVHDLVAVFSRDEAEPSDDDLPAFTDACRQLTGQDPATQLGALAATLTLLRSRARVVDPGLPTPILSQPYSWDSLSRARATSCARRNALFAARTDQLALTDLPKLDRDIEAELAALGGLVVARRANLAPSGATPLHSPPSSGSAAISITTDTLAALPETVSVPAGWSEVRAMTPVASIKASGPSFRS